MKLAIILLTMGMVVWRARASCPKDDTFCARCGGDTCLVCMASFVRRGQCQPVDRGRRRNQCLEYDSVIQKCIRCNYGFKLQPNGFCGEIELTDCLVVDPDETEEKCVLCDKRMLPNDQGKCVQNTTCSIENCMLCRMVRDEDESEEEDIEECVQCTNNFTVFRDLSNEDQCIFQIGNTLNCRITEYNNPEACLECDFNYYYSYGRCIRSEGIDITMNYYGRSLAYLASILPVTLFLHLY